MSSDSSSVASKYYRPTNGEAAEKGAEN